MNQNFEKSTLKVWYGFDKINKIRKHRALRIKFENSNARYDRKMNHVIRMGKTVERYQTTSEAIQNVSFKEFTDFVLFIDKKPFFGDIEAVLQENFNADSNNVSEEEREHIRSELKKIYREAYPENLKRVNQRIDDFINVV